LAAAGHGFHRHQDAGHGRERRGDLAAPVALKAVDDDWPLVGAALLTDGRKRRRRRRPGQAWLAEGAASGWRGATGDPITIGGQP
jgi:putative ABC transport system permease protein